VNNNLDLENFLEDIDDLIKNNKTIGWKEKELVNCDGCLHNETCGILDGEWLDVGVFDLDCFVDMDCFVEGGDDDWSEMSYNRISEVFVFEMSEYEKFFSEG